MATKTIPLISPVPGSKSQLIVHSFGPKDGQKVYIQAGLHADEHPGLLVAQHLIAQLSDLEKKAKLNAHFVVVPFANPIGLRQVVFGKLAGRCDLHTGQNFNRGMAVPTQWLTTEKVSRLTGLPEENDQQFREWLLESVHERSADYEIQALHQALLSQSIDAHYVIDLHCDDVALPHIFYGSHQTNTGRTLGQFMGANVCLEEDVTGTVAFDGTHTQPWVLAGHLGAKFHQPCFAATVELRGQSDVNDDLASTDAERLLSFFIDQGLISGIADASLLSDPDAYIGVEQVKMLSATHSGIVTYKKKIGSQIHKGDLVAEIVLIDQEAPTRIPVIAPCDGLLFSQTEQYFVSPGQTIGMLATKESQLEAGQQLAY